MTRKEKSWFFILAVLVCSSCNPLDHINSYAKASSAALDNFDKINFSFTGFCAVYQQAALETRIDTMLQEAAKKPVIHCDLYKHTDSLIHVTNSILKTYLEGIEKLSDKNLVNYKVKQLADELSAFENKIIPEAQLSDAQLSASKDILNKLLNETVNVYRKQKLKRIIADTDSAFSLVINGYIFILQSALLGELQQSIANYRSFVYTAMYGWSKTPVEKILANTFYGNFLEEMDKEQAMIKNFVRTLGRIRDGHRELTIYKDALTAASVKSAITREAITISELAADFNNLSR